MVELTGLDWKSARVRAGLSQAEASRLLGISQSQLSRFEQGERSIPEDKKLRLLEIITEKQRELQRGHTGCSL
jgi:transcriptional regulator with XRE-family HTH domain